MQCTILRSNILNYDCKIDNIFFTKENDKNIVNELYIYYFLHILSLNLNRSVVITNISLLSSLIIFHNKESYNIKIIYAALEGLQKAGFINYEYLSCVSTKKHFNPMKIEFLKRDPVNNFTLLQHWMFEKASDPKEFFVFAYIQKWKNTSHKISLNEWAKKMGYTKNGVDLLLKKMEQENKIKIISGKYESDGKGQNINDYLLVEDELKTVLGDLTYGELKDLVVNSNWGKINEFGQYEDLTQWDYDLYRTCKEYGLFYDFVGRCEDVIERMKKYPGYTDNIRNFEEEYLKQFQNINDIDTKTGDRYEEV